MGLGLAQGVSRVGKLPALGGEALRCSVRGAAKSETWRDGGTELQIQMTLLGALEKFDYLSPPARFPFHAPRPPRVGF